MERFFDQDLKSLKQQILDMGALVEKTIILALQGLVERDVKFFDEVHLVEHTINKFHVDIDQACLKLFARQSPLASDLRLVLAIIKINTDLERMGDQSVNIAHNGKHYIGQAPLMPLEDLLQMATEVRVMVRHALDAFVRGDATLAQKTVLLDDGVDALKDKIFRDLTAIMKAEPESVERSLNLILVARNLERLGDHATNIAEDVIFIASGEDIRHGGKKPEMP
jgi:phosphate transport system protein